MTWTATPGITRGTRLRGSATAGAPPRPRGRRRRTAGGTPARGGPAGPARAAAPPVTSPSRAERLPTQVRRLARPTPPRRACRWREERARGRPAVSSPAARQVPRSSTAPGGLQRDRAGTGSTSRVSGSSTVVPSERRTAPAPQQRGGQGRRGARSGLVAEQHDRAVGPCDRRGARHQVTGAEPLDRAVEGRDQARQRVADGGPWTGSARLALRSDPGVASRSAGSDSPLGVVAVDLDRVTEDVQGDRHGRPSRC